MKATIDETTLHEWEVAGTDRSQLRLEARRSVLKQKWDRYNFPLDLIGLFVAILVIYFVGALVRGSIGRRLHREGEEFLQKVPLVKKVYPSVKQITDFFLSDDQKKKMNFNRVVAVEYPRKGLWSIGLVTGDTMKDIQVNAGANCVTVFVPSSPTPFTGYVITVPRQDTIDLPITIEEALRFSISGGVVVPDNQRIEMVEVDSPSSAQLPGMSKEGDTNQG